MRGFELISRRTGSEASYYLFDGGMSVRGITDGEGILTDTLVFDAFGNEAERTGTTENSYGFQGEEQDETGLYYLRARYMDPSTGTFTSMDIYGGSLEDPMSLHKYLFANSNPVKWCDPSGHQTLGEVMGSMAIMSVLSATENAFIAGVIYQNSVTDYKEFSFKDQFVCMGIAFVKGLFIGAMSILSVFVVYALAMTALECFMAGVICGILGWILKDNADYQRRSGNKTAAGIEETISDGLFAAGFAFGACGLAGGGGSSSAENGGNLPTGRYFSGNVYRNYDSNYPAIDFEYSVSQDHRFTGIGEPGVYFSSDAATAEAEVLLSRSSGGVVKTTGQFYIDAPNMLDMTQASTRNYFGVTTEIIVGDSYTNTQAIGQWAYDNGYSGVIFPSAQSNGVNYVVFYDYFVNEI